jgi:hypothetical protein
MSDKPTREIAEEIALHFERARKTTLTREFVLLLADGIESALDAERAALEQAIRGADQYRGMYEDCFDDRQRVERERDEARAWLVRVKKWVPNTEDDMLAALLTAALYAWQIKVKP